MKKMFLAVLFLMVLMFVGNAFAQSHPDPTAQSTADMVVAAQVAQVAAQKVWQDKIDSAQKIAIAAATRGDVILERKMNEKLEVLKKELEEFKKRDCSTYTDAKAQHLCFQLTSEGTNQRLIKAYEKTFERPAFVMENADNSKITTYFPSNGGGGDAGGSETITITEGPTGSFKQVKRVRYQPLPAMFPSVAEEEGGGGVHPIVKWLVPLATGALAGGAIAGMADPDGPENGNYSFGSAGKGAMLGAATGLVVSLIWEIAD